jgi:hypothetical protein
MSDATAATSERETAPPTKNRLVELGHRSLSKKKPLTALDARAKLLVEYLTTGCPHAWISQYTRAAPSEFDPDARRPLEPGEPLKLEEAADILRIRRRHARWIMSQPIAQKELALQLQALRDGHKAEALNTVVGVMRDKGEGTAADRKVSLQAASMILGDAAGPSPAKPSVNVNVGVNLQPGIVIRLPANLPPTPLESGFEPKSTIDTHPLTRDQRMITRAENGESADND